MGHLNRPFLMTLCFVVYLNIGHAQVQQPNPLKTEMDQGYKKPSSKDPLPPSKPTKTPTTSPAEEPANQLPKTASRTTEIGLIGVLALGGGLLLRKRSGIRPL